MNNLFRINCLRLFLALALSLSMVAGTIQPAYALDLCVNPGGTDGCFASIQSAIDAAADGDVITVAAGTYNEALTVAVPGLTLQGAGDDVGSGTVISVPGVGSGIIVTASDVTLRDIRVEKGDALGDNDGRGITIGANLNNLILNGVTVTGATNGFRVGSGQHIDGLHVLNSHFDGNSIGWYVSEETASSGVFTKCQRYKLDI